MAEYTKIEWTDHTWNPWIGCTQVSPACDHCYAMVMMDHRYGRVRWGAGEDRIRTSANTWNDPLRWEQKAATAGRIETVFCLSLADIWDNEVEPIWRRDAFAVMRKTPHLLYLLLSKRIGNAARMCDPLKGLDLLPENVALGATMASQEEWDRDIQRLKDAGEHLGARFTFTSIEPMLGPINMRGNLPDWVICGGESGPNARPSHPDWFRSLRDQCKKAGVPFFFKQWGEWKDGSDNAPDAKAILSDGRIAEPTREALLAADREKPIGNATMMRRVGKRRAGAMLDGREWREMPR